MSDIKQLSEDVANQISAGEVVERPASIVKELVENSIDADSSRILIEIENGGKDKVRVKDDGTGIKRDDIELAFSRYATSKIKKVSDLYSLNTLGFRGEALASIASVSKLTAISRYKDSVKGVKIIYNGGEKLKKEVVGAPIGTDITVEELFYNTPARYKYLKTRNTEFGHISKIITQEALAYPEVDFKLEHNGRTVLSTPGTGKLADAIYAIYGEEIFSKLVELEYKDQYIRVEGFIARPSLTRSSRIHEMFFVNKRAVYSRTLSRGVENGYQGLISKGKFPVVFLFVKLNPILVDVNVHPAKKQIKFSRNKVIEKVLKEGIRKKLAEINPAVQYKMKENNDGQINNKSKVKNKNKNKVKENNNKENNNKVKNNQSKEDNMEFNFGNEQADKTTKKAKKVTDKLINNKKNIKKKKIIYKSNSKNSETYKSDRSEIDDQTSSENIDDKSNINIKKVMGQIFLSYILVEAEDGLYIIDQHNAHERILFDKFFNKYKKNSSLSQKLLTPVNLELTPGEVELLNKNTDSLKKLGFQLESFGGNSFLIQAVPTILNNKPAKEIIREIIDRLVNDGDLKNGAELIKDIIEFMACRTAIKANRRLNDEEIEKIVNDLFKTKNPFRCPHGRPILIRMSRKEVDRGVGR